MDSPSFASKLYLADHWLRLHTYHSASEVGIHTLMPGHNGLFARQLPIASSYFEYLDIAGFHRRRSNLFAIMQFALSNERLGGSALICILSQRMAIVRIVISFQCPEHSPGHACSFKIGQGHRGHVWIVVRLGDRISDPATEPVDSFVFCNSHRPIWRRGSAAYA